MVIKFREGDMDYGVEVTGRYISSPTISYRNRSLVDNLHPLLEKSQIVISDPFDSPSKEIIFIPGVAEFCNKIFDLTIKIKARHGENIGTANMADYLFQAFTPYWRDHLLRKGLDVLGIKFWHNILAITKRWEQANKPHIIHKGTLYYFLAENYLLTGDRDFAYVYLYNAIESDRLLQTLMDFNPNITPAYLTALLEDNTHNHMYPLILNVRNFLQEYIHKYRTRFKTQFSLTDFDLKFLKNPHLRDIAYFFVYNLLYLFSLRSYTSIELIQNDFSRLKALDVFFNLCLIIDETLKVAYRKTKGTLKNPHYITESIIWLVEANKWMTKKGELQNLWGKNHLNVNDAHPDVIIPKLLKKSELYEGKVIRNEIFSLLLVYKLRNYGGHNIQQPKVFTENYLAIIEELFMALFLSIRVL